MHWEFAVEHDLRWLARWGLVYNWHPEEARRQLREFLEAARGCHVELIMKDISTVRYHPHRLWEWAQIAMEEAQDFPT